MPPPRLLKEMRSMPPREKRVKHLLVSEELTERSDFPNLLCSDQQSRLEKVRELEKVIKPDKCD